MRPRLLLLALAIAFAVGSLFAASQVQRRGAATPVAAQEPPPAHEFRVPFPPNTAVEVIKGGRLPLMLAVPQPRRTVEM